MVQPKGIDSEPRSQTDCCALQIWSQIRSCQNESLLFIVIACLMKLSPLDPSISLVCGCASSPLEKDREGAASHTTAETNSTNCKMYSQGHHPQGLQNLSQAATRFSNFRPLASIWNFRAAVRSSPPIPFEQQKLVAWLGEMRGSIRKNAWPPWCNSLPSHFQDQALILDSNPELST